MFSSVLARRRRKNQYFVLQEPFSLCVLVIFSKKSRKCFLIAHWRVTGRNDSDSDDNNDTDTWKVVRPPPPKNVSPPTFRQKNVSPGNFPEGARSGMFHR